MSLLYIQIVGVQYLSLLPPSNLYLKFHLKLHFKFNQLERSGKFFQLPGEMNECLSGGRMPVPGYPSLDRFKRPCHYKPTSVVSFFATISPGSGNTVCQLSAHVKMRSTPVSTRPLLANIKFANWQMVAVPGDRLAWPCLAHVTVSTVLM